MITKIGFGGGCHWCTEAVFQSLIGVSKVEQGFISSKEFQEFSEAVIVHFDNDIIPLRSLIEIHLHTHRSTKNHSMRDKYRSAVYVFDDQQRSESSFLLDEIKLNFSEPIVTQILYFDSFQSSEVRFKNYYFTNPRKPFCERYIHPKLTLLMNQFSNYYRSTHPSKNENHQIKN